MSGLSDESKSDYFVTYHHRDELWAQWIAWQLEAVGHTVRAYAWDLVACDLPTSQTFVDQIRRAVKRANRTIAILSCHNPSPGLTVAEWDAAFEHDPAREVGWLIPLLVDRFRETEIVDRLEPIRFFSRSETDYRNVLFKGVGIQSERQATTDDDLNASHVLHRALRRWQDKHTFLQLQQAKRAGSAKKNLIARAVEEAEHRIRLLQRACQNPSANAANELRPLLPFDLPGPAVLNMLKPDGTPKQGDTYYLQNHETTIGRHTTCDLTIYAGGASRCHAKIVRSGEKFSLEDLDSRNGTRVNGTRIRAPHPLREGDVIRISHVELVFMREQPYEGGGEGLTEEFQNGPSASRKYEALTQMISNITASKEFSDLLKSVLASVFDMFPQADRAFIALLDANGQYAMRCIKSRDPEIADAVFKGEAEIITPAFAGMDEWSRDLNASRNSMCARMHDRDGNSFGAIHVDASIAGTNFLRPDYDRLNRMAVEAGGWIADAMKRK